LFRSLSLIKACRSLLILICCVSFRLPRESTTPYGSQLISRFKTLIDTAFPLQRPEVHLFASAVAGNHLATARSAWSDWVDSAHIHEVNSVFELVAELSANGIRQRGIPDSLGGTWDSSRFEAWKKRRLHIERSRLMTDRERVAVKRAKQSEHSRRKRERQSQEVARYQQAAEVLRTSRWELEQENRWLTRLLEQAQRTIESTKTENGDDHVEKESNAAVAAQGYEMKQPPTFQEMDLDPSIFHGEQSDDEESKDCLPIASHTQFFEHALNLAPPQDAVPHGSNPVASPDFGSLPQASPMPQPYPWEHLDLPNFPLPEPALPKDAPGQEDSSPDAEDPVAMLFHAFREEH